MPTSIKLLLALFGVGYQLQACELLVVIRPTPVHPDAAKDRMRWKAGQVVAVREDGAWWSAGERFPHFGLVKIPGIPAEAALKYMEEWRQNPDDERPFARRRWRFKVADVPAATRNKLVTTGSITIKAGGYSGPFDMTWNSVRQHLFDDKGNASEGGNQ